MISLPKAVAAISFLPLVLFTACAPGPKTDQEVVQVLESSLLASTKSIRMENQLVFISFQERLADFRTQEKARRWLAKVQLIREESAQLMAHIEQLKNGVRSQTGFQEVNGRAVYKKDKAAVVAQYFRQQGRGEGLYQRLGQYRARVLQSDSFIYQAFAEDLPLRFSSNNPSQAKAFIQTYLEHQPAATLALLSQLQNSVVLTENGLLRFCLEQTALIIDHYYAYSAIVGQSHSHVRAGEKMEVVAGVGSFSKTAQPTITVKGQKMELSEDGAAYYRFRASRKSGKHTLPVSIEFTDQDGKRMTISKTVEYTVVNAQGW